uniref:Potassium channel domain-containing protein n=1 Tax=Fagus sylvatica TaxID=28930 RepID=A0A2N9F0B2_FAGSY
MASNDAKESLLPEFRDHSHSNEKNDLQRRRHRRGGTASSAESIRPEQNGVESPLHPESLSVKQQFNFKQVFMLLAVYLGGGTICFFLIRHRIKGQKTNGILDAIYFCVVTMTTVGYGDLVPNTMLAKILASIYVFTGMAIGGLILSQVADYIVEKQEILMLDLHARKPWATEILKEVADYIVEKQEILIVRAIYMRENPGATEILKEVEIEELSFMDAFYCVCSTITTLGYGDESFSTRGGRIFAIFWILSSTICLAQFFLYLAELCTERRQRAMANWVLTRKLTFSDLEAADLDHDKIVSAAEFVVYKLEEMGKISHEDVSVVMETFKRLDADQSGTLTTSDLLLSQSS